MVTLIGLVVFLQIITLIIVQQQINLKRSNKKTGKEIILDTCALIDGRILELAKTGFMPTKLVVPEFVIAELQLLADGTNNQKRQRARHGLDMIRELQDNKKVTIEILRKSYPNTKAVDQQLIMLAKERSAALYTVDYNLNKVADIEGVEVLNVNELAHLLRPIVLPGEQVTVKIVQKGAERNQGIGYLEDGTMVVVDKAANKMGLSLTVNITRNLQTVAGKMMFGEPIRKAGALFTKSSKHNNL